jgi:hypothetical protein
MQNNIKKATILRPFKSYIVEVYKNIYYFAKYPKKNTSCGFIHLFFPNGFLNEKFANLTINCFCYYVLLDINLKKLQAPNFLEFKKK